MGGRPVWLASMSRRDGKGRTIATGMWRDGVPGSAFRYEESARILHEVLDGVGNPAMERLFRMNVVLCMHRAATDAEIAGLPPSWHEDLGGLAGIPVEVISAKGCTALESAMPCHNPQNRFTPHPSRPDLWIPLGCDTCPPCVMRAELGRKVVAAR
jgi:hypothetical protein